MKLEDLEIYNLSMDLSDEVWEIVMKWEYFPKDTIGKQWTRAIDSVSANISEGIGRNSFKDSRTFYYYSRGSLYESKTWFEKAKRRKLVSEEVSALMLEKLNKLGIKMNNFINAHEKLIEKSTNQHK
jgi:four helix bundle protein